MYFGESGNSRTRNEGLQTWISWTPINKKGWVKVNLKYSGSLIFMNNNHQYNQSKEINLQIKYFHLKTDAEGEGKCDQNQNWKSSDLFFLFCLFKPIYLRFHLFVLLF